MERRLPHLKVALPCLGTPPATRTQQNTQTRCALRSLPVGPPLPPFFCRRSASSGTSPPSCSTPPCGRCWSSVTRSVGALVVVGCVAGQGGCRSSRLGMVAAWLGGRDQASTPVPGMAVNRVHAVVRRALPLNATQQGACATPRPPVRAHPPPHITHAHTHKRARARTGGQAARGGVSRGGGLPGRLLAGSNWGRGRGTE